ncbi:MAG TPA: HAD family phosphatase [Verrucomicrobiae bacterium]|nr:HAD family phosphatase [Verrucomicrobiae bacterium]
MGAVIFDLDGTLIESEQIWSDVRHAFVVEHGGRWPNGAQERMIGMRTTEWAHYMHDDLGVTLPPQAIAEQVVTAVAQRLARDVPVLPGAADALERLAAAFPLGLATAAARAVAETVLAKTGWTKYFEVVVSADDVARGKPAPDVYLRALQLMGADPRRTAAVEDSANGIRSAHAAKLAVVAIPNQAFPPDREALSLADRVLSTIGELDVTTINDVLARR